MTPYKAGYGPFAHDVWRVPYAYCYRCAFRRTHPDCAFECVSSLEDYFKRHVDPRTIAAVVVEPVLGEGGFVVPPPGYLSQLAAFCRKHGILIIADEVQTGFGRTGRMFACEHDGVEPDLLVTAKSLAAGLPLAAIVGRADLMDAPGEGGLGGTYVGSPMACAAAHAVLDRFESGELLRRSEAIGVRIEARVREWGQRFAMVGDVRRRGAMVGVELVRNRETREPAKHETDDVIRMACRTRRAADRRRHLRQRGPVPDAAHHLERRARRRPRSHDQLPGHRRGSSRRALNRRLPPMWYYRRLPDGLVVMQTRPEHARAARGAAAGLLSDARRRERFKAAHYRRHIELFPDGQFVALDGRRVVGATTTLRLHFDFDHIDHTFADIIQGGWLTSHEPDGDWLYGADVGVDPAYRGRGLAARAVRRAAGDRSGVSASRAR